jgi:hypothetical protein
MAQEPNGNEKTIPTVSSMAPEYPRHRNAIIVICLLVGLAILVGGAFFLAGKFKTSFDSFLENPHTLVTRFIKGFDTYTVCESFLMDNLERFPQLGKNPTFYPVKQEYRFDNRRRTAKTVMRLQSSAGQKSIYFYLEKRKGTWHINAVVLGHPDGTFETLYPPSKKKNAA